MGDDPARGRFSGLFELLLGDASGPKIFDRNTNGWNSSRSVLDVEQTDELEAGIVACSLCLYINSRYFWNSKGLRD